MMDKLALLETGFEGYPADYISHNVPLIMLSGLESDRDQDDSQIPGRYQEGSLRVGSEDLSPITGKHARALLEAFRRYERNDEQWNNSPVLEGSQIFGFKFKVVGRTYQLLPRKAKVPSQDLGYEPPGSPDSRSPPHWILHSPISPLTPGSPLFPDGVMSAEWIAKHQQYVPSVFMVFLSFVTDPARNSLLDNQLKAEINNVKATLYRSEYKSKLVVLLLSDKNLNEAPEIEDRLAMIRRATGLDSKTGLFFLPAGASDVDIQTFVDGVLVALQPGCVEYYRDLTKHARRKKNRGNIPAPTAPPIRGTSQTLSATGWGGRYDFKMGVLAEFRQEMESACRHYTAALEALLSPDGILETTASWSPRWEEGRLLTDIVAMRILRCLLWSNMTTTAVQSWSNYRYRLRELVDRRGKGSSNYGWEAWDSRWSRMMAELVRRAQLSAFQFQEEAEFKIHAPVEKTFPIGERVKPFDHLHHPAYWFKIAAKHSRRRRRFAQDLPEEDCLPPGQSPASAMASRYGTYDTYLVPEPWQERPMPDRKTYNHAKEIFSALSKASGYLRAQPRAFDEDMLEIARELLRNKQYSEAMSTLYNLWERMSWRRDQWWDLVFEVTRSLRECAKYLGDSKVLAAADFELYSNTLPSLRSKSYNLLQSGAGLSGSDTESLIPGDFVELDARKVTAFITTNLTFSSGKGNAGEPLRTQLTIHSNAQQDSTPVILDGVEINLQGSMFAIHIKNVDHGTKSQNQIQDLTLLEGPTDSNIMIANANLQLRAGETLVLEFGLIFRDAGPVVVEDIVISITTAAAVIKYITIPEKEPAHPVWWRQGPQNLIETTLTHEQGHVVQIQPRPPKMELRLPNIDAHFYTDEEIELLIDVFNGEEEPTKSSLEVRISTPDGLVNFNWVSGTEIPGADDLVGHEIGTLEPGASAAASIIFPTSSLPMTYAVEVRILYHLHSDLSTPVSKTLSGELAPSRAFEANYDFQPRVHPAPWASFFSSATVLSPGQEDTTQNGISHRWELGVRIASFAYEGLLMTKVELRQEILSPQATATITPLSISDGEIEEVAPQQQMTRNFQIDIQKHSLEDRRSLELEVVLAISWSRPGKGKRDSIFTSLLPVDNFVLENGPRVLAAVSYPAFPQAIDLDEGEHMHDAEQDIQYAQVTFTLENPTNHFLTFELAMEGPQREEWAYSGPKMRTLNLLPLSRESVYCRLLPLARTETDDTDTGEAVSQGKWLEIRFRVMDVYFRKVLRCLPASAGVREVEGKGGSLLIWAGGLRSAQR